METDAQDILGGRWAKSFPSLLDVNKIVEAEQADKLARKTRAREPKAGIRTGGEPGWAAGRP